MEMNINDKISFKDSSKQKHGLHGHVKIELENPETKERKFWYEDDNIIPISGMSWILMKMFGLHLDSIHDPSVTYENPGQDTTVVIPDLNNDDQLKIGRDPDSKPTDAHFNGYTVMDDDISSNHFIQGFLVGNGGSGEDAITTKNTDYSFIKLRNPIPFQQTTASEGLDSSISGKYLGLYRQEQSNDQSFYIKKFDERAHIYHNWWRDGQRWDYIDPVRQSDLGPDAINIPKTNRIETYAEVQMSIDTKNGDCLGYFKSAGNTQTAMINELGLVAFDTIPGERSIVEMIYKSKIKRFINLVFDNNRSSFANDEVIALALDISTVLTEITSPKGQSNINAFNDIVTSLASGNAGNINYEALQQSLTEVDSDSQPTNIGVEAFYNQNGSFIYASDKFLDYLHADEFATLSIDEAQRIKLITYYTFNSIPLQTNWKILINYRIYAN